MVTEAAVRDSRLAVMPRCAPQIRRLAVVTGPEIYDVAVIGAGPAGLAAAVSAAADGLKTTVVDAYAAGGSAVASPVIQNYPGFADGVSGAELTRRIYEQAKRLGAIFALTKPAVGLSSRGAVRAVTLAKGATISAHAVVIATGIAYRTLGIPSVDKLTGAGVHYADVVSEPAAMAGQEGLRLRHRVSGTTEAARTRSLFVMMGADPNTEWLKGSLLRDEDGYLVTGDDLVPGRRLPQGWPTERAPLLLETSVPHVFAA